MSIAVDFASYAIKNNGKYDVEATLIKFEHEIEDFIDQISENGTALASYADNNFSSIEKVLRSHYEKIAKISPSKLDQSYGGTQRSNKQEVVSSFVQKILELVISNHNLNYRVEKEARIEVTNGVSYDIDFVITDNQGDILYLIECGDYKDTTMLTRTFAQWGDAHKKFPNAQFLCLTMQNARPNKGNKLAGMLSQREITDTTHLLDLLPNKRHAENKTEYLLSRSSSDLEDHIIDFYDNLSRIIK